MRPPLSRRCWTSPCRRKSRWSCSSRRKSTASGKRSSTRWTTSFTWIYRRLCRMRHRSIRSSRCWNSPRRNSSATAWSCVSERTGSIAPTWCVHSPSSVSNRWTPSHRWLRRTLKSSRRTNISSWSTTSKSRAQTQTKPGGCVFIKMKSSPIAALSNTKIHFIIEGAFTISNRPK